MGERWGGITNVMCVFTRGSGSTKCRERWGGITNVMCVCLLEGLGPPSGGEMGWYY